MGMFIFLPKWSFKMGTFSDLQHTHLSIFILELPPNEWWFEGDGGGG